MREAANFQIKFTDILRFLMSDWRTVASLLFISIVCAAAVTILYVFNYKE